MRSIIAAFVTDLPRSDKSHNANPRIEIAVHTERQNGGIITYRTRTALLPRLA
jgi:hypothetical protein